MTRRDRPPMWEPWRNAASGEPVRFLREVGLRGRVWPDGFSICFEGDVLQWEQSGDESW